MGRSKIVVTANEVRSIVSRYNKGQGLILLAVEFGYGVAVIRRILEEKGVSIRDRGRPVLSE